MNKEVETIVLPQSIKLKLSDLIDSIDEANLAIGVSKTSLYWELYHVLHRSLSELTPDEYYKKEWGIDKNKILDRDD